MILVEGKEWKDGDIKLKHLTGNDASDAYVNWLNDPDVNKFLEVRFSKRDYNSVKNFILSCNKSENNALFGIFKVSGIGEVHVGNIKLGSINFFHKYADIGLMIGDKNCWGKGYGTKAIKLVCRIARDQLGLRKIWAGFYGENKGSFNAFLKVGFVVAGELKDHVVCDKGIDSVIIMEKLLGQNDP